MTLASVLTPAANGPIVSVAFCGWGGGRSNLGRDEEADRWSCFMRTEWELNTKSPPWDDVRYTSVFGRILLQKSKVASVRIFGETLKREAIDDSYNLSRFTEVAYEFSVRR